MPALMCSVINTFFGIILINLFLSVHVMKASLELFALNLRSAPSLMFCSSLDNRVLIRCKDTHQTFVLFFRYELLMIF